MFTNMASGKILFKNPMREGPVILKASLLLN
jgi:hypothetical protein